MDDVGEYATLDALIARLEQTPILSPAEEVERSRRRREFLEAATRKMIDDGLAYGEASGDLALYNQTEESFRAEIRNSDNDLPEQVVRFNHGLDRWFEYGECHPPYFPWRIAVILSKRKQVERERAFLASYCRHFWDRRGRRDEMIVARAEQKGAFDRFNR